MQQLVYNVNPSAKLAHEAPLDKGRTQIKVVYGPMGSGKSTLALWEWFIMCLKAEGPLYGAVVRASYRELIDSTKKLTEQWFGPFTTWREGDEEFWFDVPNEKGELLRHTLCFRSIQKAAHTQKFQSVEYNFVWMEEVVPAYNTSGIVGSGLPEEIVGIAMGRLRLKTAKDQERILILTANPPFKNHWLYKSFIMTDEQTRKVKNIAVVWQPPGENKANLPNNYYDGLRQFMDDAQMRRFVNGEVVAAFEGKPVFPECKDHYHITDKPVRLNRQVELVLGHDFGLTPATLITQVLPTGQWVWLDELVMFNRSVDDHFEELRTKLNEEPYKGMTFRCWGDPSGVAKSQTDAKSAFEIAASKGFSIKPGKIDWMSRKEAIKQRLNRTVNGEPALIINRLGCDTAVTGMLGGYRYHVSPGGEPNSRPEKNMYSHIMDAAQYIATGEFSILSSREEAESLKDHLFVIPKWNPLASPEPKKEDPPSWLCH